MLDVPENLCVPLLTVTPPNAAAADILLTPSPPKKIDRCAAAAGQNHPARRRRNTDVGAGLYLKQGWGGKIQQFCSLKRDYVENGSRYGQSYYLVTNRKSHVSF